MLIGPTTGFRLRFLFRNKINDSITYIFFSRYTEKGGTDLMQDIDF